MPLLQHPDLEAHLADHPDDDESWMVYADWLQDRGDVRGEMIVTELRGKSAKELHREHAARLLAPLQEIDPRFGVAWPVRFRRGFPSRVQVDDPAVLARLAASPLARFVQQLSVRELGGADEAGLVARLANLRTVLIGHAASAHLEPFAALRFLERVSLSICRSPHFSIDSPTLRRLEVGHAVEPKGSWRLPAIEELRLSLDWSTKVFPQGFVEWLRRPPYGLRVVRLQRTGAPHGRALAQSPLLAQLTVLELTCCEQTQRIRETLSPVTRHLALVVRGD